MNKEGVPGGCPLPICGVMDSLSHMPLATYGLAWSVNDSGSHQLFLPAFH